ncbi:hypothetical protein SK128_024227 [Halocaridina rubra]|uniref:RING-type domain-containing protein n=1 Tax=Halocaridina rubra TaxID=373956 RepID=A0AAN8WRD0_HALRR
MGDASISYEQLSREIVRYDSFDDAVENGLKSKLARAGFYSARNGKLVKCFSCSLELDLSQVNENTDFFKMHIDKKSDCNFVMQNRSSNNARSKKFLSYDSLRFEKERLQTFIEWPLPWLSPRELAADGFYFLRTHDHCACVFCRGIVGAWEVGDTPRGEHHRHFPHCPFIRGQPVGNVPMTHSGILDSLPLDGEECPTPPPRCETAVDVTGTSSGIGRHMPGSYPECKGPQKKNNVNYDSIGLPKYSGPKRKDYVTKESRLKSFTKWPERVVQKPEEMAEAGFFYCGLSDHVRCFHCGSGLRNWEINDKPWEEHARWYPDCSFVLLSKGQEFIDKVRRENPPYLRTAAKDGKLKKAAASSGHFKQIKESDLDMLMKLDIIQAVSAMGFPVQTIRKALRQKLEQTGLPFFSLEPCIESILQLMEEETRQAIQENNSEVESEARERQNDKILAMSSQASNDISSTNVVAGPSHNENSSSPSTANVSASGTPASVAINVEPPETNTENESHIIERSEAMDVEEQSEQPEVSVQPTVSESQTLDLPNVLREADEVMSVAGEVLKPSPSGPSSLEEKQEVATHSGVILEGPPSDSQNEAPSAINQARSEKNIAEELERIRESRMCKICMDAEMSVVFLPCTHMAACSSCAVTMATCPICRMDIKYTIKPIFS